MTGGRLFMMYDKMLCATPIDKKYGDQLLIARISEYAYPDIIKKDETLPMGFTASQGKVIFFFCNY
jgi:hypothetical protein